MPWTTTLIDSYYVGNPATGHPRLVTVNECVYSGTGYGGGYGGSFNATGATGATGPSLSELGFTDGTDSTVEVQVYEYKNGTPIVKRTAVYDIGREMLIVGVTAGTDISGVTYRVVTTGRYGP